MLSAVGACSADASCRQLIRSLATNTPILLSVPMSYITVTAADSNLDQVIDYESIQNTPD
jgi:hypothetical protein